MSRTREPRNDQVVAPERGNDGRIARKARHLEDVAEVGESEQTPWITIGGVWILWALVFVIALSLALVAYRLAA